MRVPSISVLASAMLAMMLFPRVCPAQDQCNLAKDIVVQALERIRTGTDEEVTDGLELLKHANEICVSSGDAWYYRSVFERKLGLASKADYSLKKAKMFGSEAMDEGADPFHLATGGPSAPATIGPLREKWALVIGISAFHDQHLHPLAFANKDAKDFAALLVDPAVGRFKTSNVHSLTEGEITTKQLKLELNWLARSAQPNDLVVIFLSTHGTPRNKDTAEVNYIATSDTEMEPEDNLFATSVSMVGISDIVRTRIRAQRTVIFLDTCHSGAAAANSQGRTPGSPTDSAASAVALDRIRQGVGRAIVTSSAPDELSYEGRPFDNGYFTHFLLEALRRDNGQLSIEQIYGSLKDNVAKAARSIERKQTPVLSTSEHGGEIVIGAASGS